LFQVIDESQHPLFPDVRDVIDHFQVLVLIGLVNIAIWLNKGISPMPSIRLPASAMFATGLADWKRTPDSI